MKQTFSLVMTELKMEWRKKMTQRRIEVRKAKERTKCIQEEGMWIERKKRHEWKEQ